MPAELPKDAMEAAEASIAFAQQVRRYHRRRTKRHTPQREADIVLALERLRDSMIPLRSEIGRFPYGPATDIAEANREAIRAASASIQSERRKLWKMSRTKESV